MRLSDIYVRLCTFERKGKRKFSSPYVALLTLFVIICVSLIYRNRKSIESTTMHIPPERDFAFEDIDELVYRKRPEVQHVDCARIFRDDKDYIKQISKIRPKLVKRGVQLSMSCSAIQDRMLPPSNPDTGFPILHARLVYKDYEFLEDQLVTNYASENVYCFSIDRKASPTFMKRIAALEKCLPNVVVAKNKHYLDSAGHNHNEAHLDCIRATRDKQWEYAVLLQNHDVILKTHMQMTEILRIYGGANDIEIMHCPSHRCLESLEKNLGTLELCPHYLTGPELSRCNSSDIHWVKGSMEAMISRAAFDYIFDKINVFPLIRQMNEMDYGVDEMLYQSLSITPEIRLPGGFTGKCTPQFIAKLHLWESIHASSGFFGHIRRKMSNLLTGPVNDCSSGKSRHGVCIHGVESLPMLASSEFIMVNKMLPDFDVAATSCMSELLFNRTRDGESIDRHFYENLNVVRYHRERNLPGFSLDNFECELSTANKNIIR